MSWDSSAEPELLLPFLLVLVVQLFLLRALSSVTYESSYIRALEGSLMKGGSVQRRSALHQTFCGEYHVHLLCAFNIGLGGDEVPAAVTKQCCSAAGALAPFAHAETQARSVHEAPCGVHAQRRGPVSYFQHHRTANWL